MTKPNLYVFAISHYCEKARWTLDYLGIDHSLVVLAPGLHVRRARKLGVSGSTLPILETGEEVVQGSAQIVDWADAHTQTDRTLTPEGQREQCLEIERRLDDVVGVHVRRFFYSEALVEHSADVKPIFTKDLRPLEKAFVGVAWPLVRKIMIKQMDLGFEQGQSSREILEGELTWLDEMLSDGRRFLVADQFSRADLAAAALLARLSGAEEHPAAENMSYPPGIAEEQQRWHDRPCVSWIRGLYRDYR